MDPLSLVGGARDATLTTTLHDPPTLSSYVPLAEHQSRTPVSFFDGPPVLHDHQTSLRAYLPRNQRTRLPWGSSTEAERISGLDDAWDGSEDQAVHVVDVFVGSDQLVLFCPSAKAGVALPYPVIGLHAVKGVDVVVEGQQENKKRVSGVYMQLELAGDQGEDEDGTVELTIVPPDHQNEEDKDATTHLFAAISACADLHPDRADDDDDDNGGVPNFFAAEDGGDAIAWEEGDDGDSSLVPVEGFQGVFQRSNDVDSDLPPPMPGSGGWITAANAHQFFDEDGNWRGNAGAEEEEGTPLGQGAGRVRGRDEGDAAETSANGTNGTREANGANGDEESESKRVRTE